MAVKKSELYSSLWQSCDELRGGMDASQYKDYVLVMLFIKYVSDKYAGKPFALYKGVVALLRAYAGIADELEAAGYTPDDVARIKGRLEHYLKLREVIRHASGEMLDLKAYEADMRHLIDTYIEASEPRTISPFAGMSLMELIVKSGIADAIGSLPDGVRRNRDAVAETIENNVRSRILREHLHDPAYYEKMSALLAEIIDARKRGAIEYEEYLKRIAELAKHVQAGLEENAPEALKRSPGLRALYNNLKDSPLAAAGAGPEPGAAGSGAADPVLQLASAVHERVLKVRQDGFRGVQAKENVVKRAFYEILQDRGEVERIFAIVKAQPEY
jgi:type I restriction enzyme R subunit